MGLLLMKKMEKNWILIISLLFFSCSKNNSIDSIILRDDFKNILIDVQNKQSNIELYASKEDTVSVLDSVLLYYNLDEDAYRKTVLFYTKNPEILLDILHEVADSLKQ